MFIERGLKRFCFIFLISIFVSVQFLILFSAQPTKAVVAPVVVTGDIPAATTEIKKTIGATILGAAMGGLMNGFSYFMRKLAYDSAMWVSSGGSGQGSLAFKDGFGNYLKKVGKDSLAETIEQIGQPFGLNLCQTPDLQFQVFLQIGIKSMYVGLDGIDPTGANGPTPNCDWQTLKNSWSAEAFEAKYGSGGSKLIDSAFNDAIRVENSDFGLAFGSMARVENNMAAAKVGAQASRLEGSGYKAVTQLITGDIKAPADIVREETTALTKKHQQTLDAGQIAGIYGSGMLQVIPQAMSVFLNTLVSEEIKKAQEKLTGLFDDNDSNSSSEFGISNFDSASFTSNRKKAQAAFSQLITLSINTSRSYSQLNEFFSCDTDSSILPGLDNCVIDEDFKKALDQANINKPLTIQEAMDSGLLHSDWPLISPDRISDNTSRDCRNGKYCYSNIQKLRRNRVLPLGFEIAAKMADVDNPQEKWTLGKVVAGFNDCKFKEGTKEVIPDPTGHPYCRLIDPNWILRAPVGLCSAKVYGPTLNDINSGSRSQYCADLKTCLFENADGTCDANNYGYCTREKNVWRFNADSCNEEYNTCTGFVNANNETNYYLARTIDYGQCNLSSVGCRPYSTEKINGKWVDSVNNTIGLDYSFSGRNPILYFNDKLDTSSCSSQDDGCSQFYLAESNNNGGYINSYSSDNLAYIKKAPGYLNCYDTNINTPNIDWPETKQDLNKIVSDSKCNSYAQVCLPEEVGCDLFTAMDGSNSTPIPAVVGTKTCSEGCVGYNVFKQEKTEYSNENFPLYFIPKNAVSCASQYVGCDEYTNIDNLSVGGENLEYYTKIKYCEKPSTKNQAVYYSWEGSETGGYILKVHNLKTISTDDFTYLSSLEDEDAINFGNSGLGEIFPVGSPTYNSNTGETLNNNYALCNKESYENYINNDNSAIFGLESGDCRALYDRSGNVFYRLLSATVEISDKCHMVKKTDPNYWEDDMLSTPDMCDRVSGKWRVDAPDGSGKCLRCLGGGIYDKTKDSCIYLTTGEVGSCSASFNGCREYTGNQGKNIQKVFGYGFDFEPTGQDFAALSKITNGWSNNVEVSAEALQVGKHSLKINGGISYFEINTSSINNENNLSLTESTQNGMFSFSWYELSFWARGENTAVSIYFEQGGEEKGRFTFDVARNQMTSTTIGYDWRLYKLGPIQFTGRSNEPVRLVFSGLQDKNFYVDKMQLVRLTDTHFLIKDSWKTKEGYNVPLSCDSEPYDAYPGDALGCGSYKQDSNNSIIYATGFDKLCRQEAVGCRALYDTYNTEDVSETAYNVWCSKPEGGVCTISLGYKEDTGELNGQFEEYKCNASLESGGCYIDKIVLYSNLENLNSLNIVSSTIFIPEDTPSESPIYLTAHKSYSCEKQKKGCQLVGAEDKILSTNDTNAFKHIDTYIINDPDKYTSQNLDTKILCQKDVVGCEEFKSGSDLSYFKDPQKTGKSFCEYSEKTDNNGINLSGWLKKGVGYCYKNGLKTGAECSSSEDCGTDGVCEDVGEVPCYNDYLLDGGDYGIWSNGNTKYRGLVGVCPSSANNCREIIDPADKTSSINKNGKPYYVIYDNKITANLGDCDNGSVSQKMGCVLFNKTDQPNLLYNSNLSYQKSVNNNDNLVLPVSSSTINDSNVILKVQRDRECGEWLACRGYLSVPDTQSENQERNACYSLQACEKGSGLNCEREVDPSEYVGKRLTYDEYVTRSIGWTEGKEYSGYSLYEQYHVADLEFVNVKVANSTSTSKNKLLLGYTNKENNSCDGRDDGVRCGSGVCYKENCVLPPNGSYPSSLSNKSSADTAKLFYSYLYSNSCRAYPTENSPFTDKTNSIVSSWYNNVVPKVWSDTKYQNAKICLPGEDCDCNYTKVEYGQGGVVNFERYFSFGSTNKDLKKGGVCQGGERDGLACSKNEDCGDQTLGGVCVLQQKISNYIGWNGYCLERDYSRRVNGRTDDNPEAFACLTWYPLDYVPSLFDIYFNDPGKGYVPPGEVGNPGKLYCTEMIGLQNLRFKSGEWCDLRDCTEDICTKDSVYCGPAGSDLQRGNNNRFNPSFSNPSFYYDPNSVALVDLNTLYIKQFFSSLKLGEFGEFERIDFSLMQRKFWDYLKVLNPNNGFGDGGGYHYLSRLDHAYLPLYLKDTYLNQGPLWDGAPYNSGKNPEVFEKMQGLRMLSLLWMLNGGQNGEAANNDEALSPIWPDTEIPGSQEENTWHLRSDGTNYNSWMLTSYANAEDTGVIYHTPAKSEEFLNKKMIYAVSFIPVWYNEQGDDNDVKADYAPLLGYPLTIYLDKDYPEVGEEVDVPELNKDGVGSCEFCKYWVTKTQRNVHTSNSEGYLLQWFRKDPVNGGEKAALDEYANKQTYMIDPLGYVDSKPGHAWGDISGNIPNVKCTGFESENNFLAVEVLFNKTTGKFNGYRSRNCQRTGGDSDFGYGLAVIFTLRPMCTEAVLVYDDNEALDGGVTNKAYTDNLWLGNNLPGSISAYSKEKNKISVPFGSASFNNFSTISKLNEDPWYYIYPNAEKGQANAGAPLNCKNLFLTSVANGDKNASANILDSMIYVNDYTMIGGCPKESDGVIKWGGYSFGSQNTSLINNRNDFGDNMFINTTGVVTDDWNVHNKDLIKYLFAKVFKVAKYDIVNQKWEEKTAEQLSFVGEDKNNGSKPYIYPPKDCKGNVCKLDAQKPNNFSINGVYDTLPSESLYGKSSKFVDMEFFTWAGHNQMPIRRIIVDWRDKGGEQNTISGDMMGYYSNYKPYCGVDGEINECVSVGSSTSTGMTCEDKFDCSYSIVNGTYNYNQDCVNNGLHFGNIAGETCVNRPIKRFFNYTCDANKYKDVGLGDRPNYVKSLQEIKSSTDSSFTGLDSFSRNKWYEFLQNKGLKDESLVCVYRPQIQILDNWGWCTGSCSGNNGKGCFEEQCDYPSTLNNFAKFTNIIVISP